MISPRFWTYTKVIAGPVLGSIVLISMGNDPANTLAARTAFVAVWMGVWWLTEAVPLAVTSLLPLALIPLFGVMSSRQIAGYYTNDVVFLFIGGFIVALAMERWNLHKRIALLILISVGGGVRLTLLGFMIATAALSMWISNTATAMMMVPIAMAVLDRYDRVMSDADSHRLSVGLLLGIAYSASVGGIATLVGTPPNLVFASIFRMIFETGPEISFAQWMLFASPISFMLFVCVWLLLMVMYLRGIQVRDVNLSTVFKEELKNLGPLGFEEKTVLWVFVGLALSWISRKPLDIGLLTIPGWSQLFPEPAYIGDGTAAIAWATLLFILPAKQHSNHIMNWDTARKLPWRIVLLFGGGFALAGAITVSGLSLWIGDKMQGLSVLPPIVMTGSVSTIMTFLTELTSNTATTQMALPILATLAVSLGRNPFFLMLPATFSASCAFMMPVATPPNAIIFGTGRIRIIEMARTGILLNIAGILLITLWVHFAGPYFLGSDPGILPDWAVLQTPGVE